MADYATERKCDIAIMQWAETAMDRIANICDGSLEENKKLRSAICDGSQHKYLRWIFGGKLKIAICDLRWIALQIFAMLFGGKLKIVICDLRWIAAQIFVMLVGGKLKISIYDLRWIAAQIFAMHQFKK